MALLAGDMYNPTDVAVDTSGNAVYVVEHLNHRISKWNYNPTASGDDKFIFILDAGRVSGVSVAPSGGGTGYTSGDTVVISAPRSNIAVSVNAVAEVDTVSSGVITAVTVTNPGNGYDSNNLPTATAPGGNNNAILVAAVSTSWGTNGDGTTGKAGPATDGGPNDVFFDHPSNIVFDTDATITILLVTDTNHNRIRTIQTSNGNFLLSVGQGGTGANANDMYHPTGIAIVDDNSVIAISDELNHRGFTYTNNDGTLINQNILNQPEPVRFNRPHGLAHNAQSDRFTFGDSLEGLVSIYNDSTLLLFAQLGTPTAETSITDSLFYPGNGHGDVGIITSDQLFPSTRSPLIKEISGGATPVLSNITTIPVAGITEGKFYWPESFSVFQDSNINYGLLSNTRNNRIEVFEITSGPTLNFKKTFGSPVDVLQ